MKSFFSLLSALLCGLIVSWVVSCKRSTDTIAPSEPYITAFSPTQASEGDELLVKGAGFKKTPLIVKVNGVVATEVSVLSETQLKLIVPDGVTTGKLSVESGEIANQSDKELTIVPPLSAKSTVTKLTGIVAYAGSGADGVRMAYSPGSLYITGPTQKIVYRMDLTTLGVNPFLTIASNPVGIALSSDQLLFGDTGPGNYYSYRFNVLSKSTNASNSAEPFSLKAAPGKPMVYYCASFTNELVTISSTTAGGNSSSTFIATTVNSQLKGTANQANAQLATNSKSVFVFCNHALWKLQTDNSLKLVAGAAGQPGYVDGLSSEARFQDGGYARGNAIAVDEADNVYVTDYGSGCIRKVDAAGNVTTVAGSKRFFGTSGATKSGPGHKMAFRFDQFDIALDSDGRTLYVVANNDVSSPSQRFAVYKIVFTQ